MQHALNGIRVLDVTQVMAGPYCAMLLCDLGADVVKVEMPPHGDASRRMAGARGTDSPAFNAVNRGKRGVVVDMKTGRGRDVVVRLARAADVFVENARPGVMGRMGLGYADLRSVNPGLVYASISGYGQTGPHGSRGGFDLVAQGVAGIMSVTGESGGPPVKAGIPLTDLGAGLFAAIGILAALQHRARTGEGQHVDTSLVEAGVALSVWEATEFFASGRAPRPMGSAHRMSAPYQALACADGYITIGAANDRLFERLCSLLGHPEWSGYPEYANDTARVANRQALAERIEAVTKLRPRAHWLALFEDHGVPCGPINSYADVFDDEQIAARGMVVETDHPTLGRLRTLGSPLKMSRTPPQPGRPAPLLGQHTDDVLREAGYAPADVAALRAAGVVR